MMRSHGPPLNLRIEPVSAESYFSLVSKTFGDEANKATLQPTDFEPGSAERLLWVRGRMRLLCEEKAQSVERRR